MRQERDGRVPEETFSAHSEPVKVKGELNLGLHGEGLVGLVRPAERHTNGAREARRAQQF